MDNNDSLGGPKGDPQAPGLQTDDTVVRKERQEPVFSDFDEFDDFEEAERDTDYAAAYEDDGADDEFDDEDDTDSLATDWQVIGGATEPGDSAAAARNPWAVEQDSINADPPASGLHAAGAVLQEDKDLTRTDSADDWEDEDDYLEDKEDYDEEPDEGAHGWPLGMIIVGLVALVLLAAGGYGVIQQRSAAAEEIRQLQATLATAASPAEVASTREALQAMEERNTRQQATIDTLTLENRRLTDTVAGLEKKLAAPQAGAAPATSTPPKAAPVAKPAPKPAPKPAATPVAKPVPAAKPSTAANVSASSGNWFVNFSSYTQRSIADSWVKKLQPSAGKAIVASAVKDGRTYYRVRVAGLADRAQAEKVSRELQAAHGVSALWVGKE